MKNEILITSIVFISLISNVFAVEKLVINGLFQNKAVVTIDGKQRILKKDKASPEGVILIESNSEEAVIEVNGERNTYKLGEHIGSSFSRATASNTFTLAPDAGGMYTTTGFINGVSVNFVVDTGASLVFINKNVARQLGIKYKLTGKESVAYTASGVDKIYLVKFDRVRIGDIELRHVEGAVSDGDFPVVSLLGMSFLERLSMKRDGRVLELNKN